MPIVTQFKTAAWDWNVQSDLPLREIDLTTLFSLFTQWKGVFSALKRWRAEPVAGVSNQWDVEWSTTDGRRFTQRWLHSGGGAWHADVHSDMFAHTEFLPWQTLVRAEWQRLFPMYAIKRVDVRW